MDLSSSETVVNTTATNAQLPPAVRVPLTGQYLIEASAGTGKTWTLTGIVLRLLIEAKRPPEHIIATTFTRAAAAEMRERIHARLVDFYQLLQWLNVLQANPVTHAILYPQLLNINADKKDSKKDDIVEKKEIIKKEIIKKASPEQRQNRQQWLETQAKLAGNADLVADPINQHLLGYLLDNTVDYPLAEAIRRCALVLTTLDKLFVGTLDSLSQKWLSEYSAETGHQQGMQISDQEQVVIESIIHDEVRAFQSKLYYQEPDVYQLLLHSKRLTAPADHLGIAQKSIQFISTPIDVVEMGDDIDFVAYSQVLADFKSCDLTDIAPYFDKDYRKAQGFNARASIGTRAESIIDIQSSIQQYDGAFFTHLDADAQKFYEALPFAFLDKEEGGKGFNKGKEAERLAFINLASIQALKTVHDYAEQLNNYLDARIEQLNRHIALQVRQKLPSILETRRETTFALQMVRLNQALSGKQGARLARYIRHHYPVALIDESQDINGEQARMIERIYLSKNNQDSQNNNRSNRGFLLLVGDPKQAIYGFRGGDVANYNAMKTHFDAKHMMSLDINRRSNERLITALNHWFGRSKPEANPADVSESQSLNSQIQESQSSESKSADQLAQLGKNIYYQHITAANTGTRLSWQQSEATQKPTSADSTAILSDSPVSIIHLPYDKEAKYDASELTALHIAAMLASQQTLEGRPLQPSDIGVLGRTKRALKQIEDMLAKLGVPTLETAENNVFDTAMGTDLAALLEAMLRPHRRDIINRVLTSHFYQLSLDEVQALMFSIEQDDGLYDGLSQNTSIHTADVYINSDMNNQHQSELKQRYQDFQTYLKTAASQWQHNGILSALHYLIANNPLTQQSIWVGLAGLEDGARYLMDLRHLMDILAQHGMHIGEHELLAWYKKHMNSQHTPEWAQQQPLPTESGVQLMTIHKSKGLEFPVVYVVGMDGASPKAGGRDKHNLYLYDYQHRDSQHKNNNEPPLVEANSERRLSASKGKLHSKSAQVEVETDYYAQFETIENYEELRRLGYVAFTRASEQLYIVLNDSGKNTDFERKPSLQWLSCQDQKITLPERLQGYIGWLPYSIVETQAEALLNNHKNHNSNQIDSEVKPNADAMIRIDYKPAYEQVRAHQFKGWAKTSFTALSRQLSEQSQALAVFDDGIEDELDLTDSINLSPTAYSKVTLKSGLTVEEVSEDSGSLINENDIRFRFVKGANAGTFLHQVFEKIDFNNQDKWSAIIDQGIRQYQLPLSYTSAAHQQRLQPPSTSDSEKDLATNDESLESIADSASLGVAHDDLRAWVADVLAAPLLASGQPLQALAPKQRIAELGFNMGLAADFVPEGINAAFIKYLPDEPEKHIQLTSQYSDYIYRYLRGEIDLVYEYAGKYYVVDYKSNYLGNSLSNYNAKNLNAAMNKAGYWLQAAIYQVALHRFLRLRLQSYEGNETQYLGAVEYVFLRGIDSQGLHDYGRIQWQIPFALVDALDNLFGKPAI